MSLTLAVFLEYMLSVWKWKNAFLSSIHHFTARYQLWYNFNNKFPVFARNIPTSKNNKICSVVTAFADNWFGAYVNSLSFSISTSSRPLNSRRVDGRRWKEICRSWIENLWPAAVAISSNPPTVTKPEQNCVFMEFQRAALKYSAPVIVQFSSAVLPCCATSIQQKFDCDLVKRQIVNRDNKTKQKLTHTFDLYRKQIEKCVQSSSDWLWRALID